jgi:biopolymer transport protein ExbD
MIHRQPHHRRDTEGMPPLPITPMLDMSFQLLLFLIPFFRPALLEGQMDLNLPAEPGRSSLEPSRSDDEPLTAEPEMTVILRTAHDGAAVGDIQEVAVQTISRTIRLNIDRWPTELAETLRQLRDSKELSNKTDVVIEADSKIRYDFVVRVMDICARSGFAGTNFRSQRATD